MVEDLCINGDQQVKDGVVTCFLENLLNITPQELNPEHYIPFLGEQSRNECRGWDRFTGVETPGLWAAGEFSQEA